MPPRRFLYPLLALVLVALGLSGCTGGELLFNVASSTNAITPNGDGADDVVDISYSLQRDARVSVYFTDETGKKYSYRTDENRSAGDYSAAFRGVYSPSLEQPNKRIIPNGRYSFTVEAVDNNGNKANKSGELVVQNADIQAPSIENIVIRPSSISPNGDAVDDEAVISYGVTKEATVSMFVTDASGSKYLLEPPTKKSAALFSHNWNGTSNGRLLIDGTYTLHILAEDIAGNITESTGSIEVGGGGNPKLEIKEVKFSPLAVPVGGTVNVSVKVKNAGNTVLKTMGPAAGTPYTTDMNFNYWTEEIDGEKRPKYFEAPGRWRIGIMWNLAPSPYPVRWALNEKLEDLKPGEEAIITGTIRVLIPRTREIYFWASVVQEGVGFPGGQVGQQKIIVSY